jgi:monofunctional glycosyltransferase
VSAPRTGKAAGIGRTIGRAAALVAVAIVALQLSFVARIALMRVVDPQSTTFQRSEAWRLLTTQSRPAWSQQWIAEDRIATNLRRAVIASEDAGFASHGGVEWEALEKARGRNRLAEARTEQVNERLERRLATRQRVARPGLDVASQPAPAEPKVIGGSTITQQLAKNLFFAGERRLVRKAEEFVVTFFLEALLSKERILEIYLNNVEWGEGVFGAEAAARHYFHTAAASLGPLQAARLAVMLPAPKRFERRPDSPYLAARASRIAARLAAVELP